MRHRRCQGDAGAATTETVIVAPLVLFTLLLIVQLGLYFHAIDTWERSLEFCVEELGEDLWLFASDWPHGDTAWPESVEQVVKRPRLTERAKQKILAGNALRLCPLLQT